jgi:hypothetical protein
MVFYFIMKNKYVSLKLKIQFRILHFAQRLIITFNNYFNSIE